MKKLLLSGSIAVLLLPGLAFAAFNDVSLTTDADISVNSITLDVSGSTSVIESIIVNSTNFVATLQSGSIFKVSASGLQKLGYDVIYAGNQSPSIDSICTGSASTLELSPVVASTTVTVTPSSTLCAAAAVTASSGTSGSGGGSVTTVIASPVAVAATTASREAQINSIMQAIAALQAQIQTLTGAPAAQVSAISGKITSNLSSGSRGASVKTLQQFLNTHGLTVASSGPGSPGNETETFGGLTRQAVQKFQEKYNIAGPGIPGYGTVGPKTRAKINELSAQ
ncbi:MAG: peptidoglycan-binding protein [Candidatus Zambryskibacteria bacterium]|nr:peptidoglycan-binding protein [Candidatus Zambryskibacteria bacterium]